jgi:hypothetical protein
MFRRGWFGWGRWGPGRGNPYPFCRRFPWRPRWWWAYGPGPYGPAVTYPGPYPAAARAPYYWPGRRYPWW